MRFKTVRFKKPRRGSKTRRGIRDAHWLPYRKRTALLSPGELAFFRVLKRAVGARLLIAPKVRLADLITCSDTAWEAGFGHMIARQHVDFLLCDPQTSEFLCAIELDDRSHRLEVRQRRDEFLDRSLATAGFRLVRIQARATYDAESLWERLSVALRHSSTTCDRTDRFVAQKN